METPAPKRNNSSPQVDKDNASTIIDDPSITFVEGRIKHIRKDLPPLTLDDAINAACIVVLIWSGAELLVAGVECGSYCYYLFFLRNASAYSGETANITSEELAITESIFIEGAGEAVKSGEFSIIKWNDYPSNIPKPEGPFRLLEGTEYDVARKAANQANQAIHTANPSLKGMQIHEIQPVKLGGSPTDVANKIPLSPSEHAKATTWWRQLQRSLEKK